MENALREFSLYISVWAPAFAVVLFRIAGFFLLAPLIGSARIPRRARALLVLAMALGAAGAIRTPVQIPGDLASIAVGIGGEIAFGIAMGMIVSLVFVAAQWAGEIIGQQMGLTIAQAFDPQFGGAGSLIGDMYYMITLMVFMSPIVDGPAMLIRGVHASLVALPPMSASLDKDIFDLLIRLLGAATVLAIQLAAPMLVTMLVIDLALGIIGKSMPQLNVMSTGLTIRAVVGMIVLIVGVKISADVIASALTENLTRFGTTVHLR